MSARSKAVAPRGSVPRARSAVLVPWSIGPVGEVEGAGRDPTGPPREARAPSRGRARPPRVERGPVSLEGRLSRRGGRKPLVLDRPSARQQKTFRVVDGSRRAALRGSLEGERLSHRGGRASLLVERTSGLRPMRFTSKGTRRRTVALALVRSDAVHMANLAAQCAERPIVLRTHDLGAEGAAATSHLLRTSARPTRIVRWRAMAVVITNDARSR
jgi:hypothetical protein